MYLGPSLPVEYLYGMSVVTNPQQNGVIVIGGASENGLQSTLYEMTCPQDKGCHWTQLSQQLQAPRSRHVSFLVNDDPSFICNGVALKTTFSSPALFIGFSLSVFLQLLSDNI